MVIFMILGLAIVLGYLVLQIMTLRRWKGWWRLIGAMPTLFLLTLIFIIVIGVWRDRTAHNLWPMELLLWCAGGLVYLGLIHGLRKLLTRS